MLATRAAPDSVPAPALEEIRGLYERGLYLYLNPDQPTPPPAA